MRVFIAINFTPKVQSHLSSIIQKLRKEAVRGNFTRSENIHLTLVFLGEVSPNRVQEIIEVMNEATFNRDSFEIAIEGIGTFMNRGEQLYWCGVRESDVLVDLQHALNTGLKEAGFSVDEKAFKPHITLGRRCIMSKKFERKTFEETIAPAYMEVTEINLMKSEHKNGKLVYSSIGKANLKTGFKKKKEVK